MIRVACAAVPQWRGCRAVSHYGIYKIEARRLIICDVTETQRTIGGLPIGEPRYTWPTEFSGDCYGLYRD